MTFCKAQSLRPFRRSHILKAGALGIALVLTSGPLLAAEQATGTSLQAPSTLAVTKVDFKRGDDGAGRLVLQFDRAGAVADLRSSNGQVVVDIGNAVLPAELQRPLDVVDFATPVKRIDARPSGAHGAQLVLATAGDVDSLAWQSGNEYVVEIAPRSAQIATGSITAATVAQAATAVAQRGYSGRPVTFNFQDVPVRTVLQLIAEESNLNVVAADTVQGNVTLRLVNVPWDQALDIVLRAKGLDKRRDGSVVWVAPQAELAKFEQDKEDARIALEDREGLVTDYIQINYHNASQIFKALTEAKGIGENNNGNGGSGRDSQNDNGFLSRRGRIVADDRTNTLMVSDIPKKIAAMRELIDVIDRPVDQVLIEGRIVIANDTFARDLGARFGVQGRRIGDRTQVIGGSLEGNSTIINGNQVTSPGLNVDMPVLKDIAGGLAYTLLGRNFSLDMELSALQEEGRGEIISNPRIVTANQREGVIKQGKEIGYVTITGGGGGGGQATPNVQFKEVLLELKVTPTITSDDRVFLNMMVKKDEVDSYIELAGYGSVPSINRREVNTSVLVEDGQTVVIGGVYEFSDRSSLSKVPYLADTPFLGNLFKKRGRSKDKAELLVFVTPKILRVSK